MKKKKKISLQDLDSLVTKENQGELLSETDMKELSGGKINVTVTVGITVSF